MGGLVEGYCFAYKASFFLLVRGVFPLFWLFFRISGCHRRSLSLRSSAYAFFLLYQTDLFCSIINIKEDRPICGGKSESIFFEDIFNHFFADSDFFSREVVF
jgi:hypothetical protein